MTAKPPSRRRRWLPLVVVVLVIWSLTTHGKYSVSGDEPHYLIVSESLWSDGDLDLANNYAQGDSRRFGVDDLEAGPHARRTTHGRLWSSHDVGVSVVLLPIYAVATRVAPLVPESLLARVRQSQGLFAYSLISVSLILLTTVGLALLLGALEPRVGRRRAVVVVLAVALTPPVISHAFLVFPETLAFVVVCLVVWAWSRPSAALTTGMVTVVVLAAGGLPWLHRKYSFFALGLLIVLAWQHRAWLVSRPGVWKAAWLAAAILPQAALHVWTWSAWGTVGGPQMVDTVPFSVGGLQQGALGMILDRERGLLAHGPLYLVIPTAWALSWRRTWPWLVPACLLFWPLAAFAVWDAGFSPAARFLVPLAPLCALAAGDALAHRSFRWVAALLAVYQAVLVAVLWQTPRLLWPRSQGTNDALRAVPVVGPMHEGLLPSLLTGDRLTGAWLAFGVVVAFTVVVWVLSMRRAPRVADRPESGSI